MRRDETGETHDGGRAVENDPASDRTTAAGRTVVVEDSSAR
jgi:hypothetical protein